MTMKTRHWVFVIFLAIVSGVCAFTGDVDDSLWQTPKAEAHVTDDQGNVENAPNNTEETPAMTTNDWLALRCEESICADLFTAPLKAQLLTSEMREAETYVQLIEARVEIERLKSATSTQHCGPHKITGQSSGALDRGFTGVN
jgi:hypothetical protein